MYPLNAHKGLALAHLNIRSIWKKLDSIKIALDQQFQIDVLGISETWLTESIQENLTTINNYDCIRADRKWNDVNTNYIKKGGGICMYINKNLKYTTHVLDKFNISCRDVECQWVKLIFEKQRNVIVGNLYRPPQGNVNFFIDYMDGVLETVDLSKEDVFLMGDYNIDFLNKLDESYKSINEFGNQIGMDMCINSKTRFSKTKDSCLDQIITNSNFVHDSGTCDLNISDHQLVYVIHKKVKLQKEKNTFWGRSYRNYNKDEFINQLKNNNWFDIETETCPNKIWNEFLHVITSMIDNQCPLKEFRIKKVKEPWVSQELLEFIKDKDRALRKAKKTNSENDWKIAKRLRNECLHRVRNCKADFIKNELNQNQDDIKKFWNTVKTVIPEKKKNSPKLFLIDQKDHRHIAQDDLPNYINNFFADIGQNLAKKSKGTWTYDGIRSDVILHDIIVTNDEVVKACKDINVNKASGIQNISSRIIKDAFMAVPNIVRHMIQTSLNTGVFPDKWKIANIIPLQKGGEKSNVSNLRPVSLLPLPTKIIERIVHDRVMFHLERNNLLEINQGGFRKNHSTMDTIAKFSNDIFNGINKRELTVACFIDLAKAFDTVNHKILLKKLEMLGITGNLKKLFENYLTNRKQMTTIENKSSNLRDITCGVPQGSILGPMLFLMYVNDLSSIVKNCKYQLYAEDTVIYNTNNSLQISTRNVEEDLVRFINWCKGNALTVNIKKSKYVCFGLKSQTRKIKNHSLFMNNIKLDKVSSYKYLGIQLDMNLNFHKYLQDSIQRASFKIHMLSKIRVYIDFDTAVTIYKTMILPVLEYGDIAYDLGDKKSLDKLQTLQNRALRICINSNVHISRIQLHKDCKLAKLEVRRIVHLRMFMYKQKNNDLIIDRRIINTRAHDAPIFQTKRPQNEKYKRNIYYNGAIKWNSLSIDDRNILEYNVFKSKQKEWMLLTNRV